MQPSDWVADCMVPDAWLHSPFSIDDMAVACDGSALIAFPGKGREYKPLTTTDEESDPTNHIKAALMDASRAQCEPSGDLNALPLGDVYTTRLASERGIRVAVGGGGSKIYFQQRLFGRVRAFGVIYTGAQR